MKKSEMKLICDCDDYLQNIMKLNNAVKIAQENGYKYTGKTIACCPWCGLTLHAPDAAIPLEPEIFGHLEAALNILRARSTPRPPDK